MRTRPLVFLSLVVILILLALSGCSRDTAPTTDEASDQALDQVAEVTTPTTPPRETLPSSDSGAEDGVIALVNTVSISDEDFERSKQQVLSRYQQIYSQFGQDVRALLVGVEGRSFDLRIEDEALELATTRALINEELARRDALISDDEVNAEFQKQFEEFLVILGMEEEEFQQAFEAGELAGFQTGDLTFDQFISYAKQTVREEFEMQAVQRLIAGTIEHTEEELVGFFEEHRDEYDVAEQVRASHILVATEELAQQLLDDLTAGADFASLAQEHSTDTGSGARGGELGWFERGQLPAPFDEAAFSTPEGELSGIVQTQYGFHILWVAEHQPEEKPEYEEVAAVVVADFEAEIMSERFNQWYTLARSTAEISIEDLMLDAFRKQQEDVDLGLQAFLKLRDEELVDDRYLDYIIATVYQTKMELARSEIQGIEGNETIAPSQQEQIAILEAEMETNRVQALASYRSALAELGGENAEIEGRIELLEPSVDAESSE
ncbi:peptidylprolyl isomerase [Candidatus Bipolaricaulota bacterium]